jgi:hypothetical protein
MVLLRSMPVTPNAFRLVRKLTRFVETHFLPCARICEKPAFGSAHRNARNATDPIVHPRKTFDNILYIRFHSVYLLLSAFVINTTTSALSCAASNFDINALAP